MQKQINNGNNYGNPWYDADPNVWPDWGGIEWRTARTINRIIVRSPTGWSTPAAARTLPRTRVQYLATAITTRSIRVLFEDGMSNGSSTLDEIEAYWIS